MFPRPRILVTSKFREIESVDISFMDMYQNALPFDWPKMDVPGLPELVPLLNVLRLDCATPNQPLLLDEAQPEDSLCLWNSELQDLSSNASRVTTEDFVSISTIQRQNSLDTMHRTTNKSPQYPWRDIDNVFCGYSTSPLREIYVFPPCQEALRSDSLSSPTSPDSLIFPQNCYGLPQDEYNPTVKSEEPFNFGTFEDWMRWDDPSDAALSPLSTNDFYPDFKLKLTSPSMSMNGLELQGGISSPSISTQIQPHPQDESAIFGEVNEEPLFQTPGGGGSSFITPPLDLPLSEKASVVNLWGSLIAEELELESKLAKLGSQFGDHNPAVIAVMIHLSSLHFRLDHYRKAELMKRRLVDVYLQVLGPRNSKTLQTALSVFEMLLAQRQHSKAQTGNHTLGSSILKLVEQYHPLAVSANYAYARICSGSGRSEEAEKYFRQHLQIMLSLHGPRERPTINALFSLSGEIGRRMPKEADLLLIIAAQLSVELTPVDENACRLLRFVWNQLHGRGASEESYGMATKVMERFTLPLGNQHPAVWKARKRLAWSTSAIGKLPESVKLFRAVISRQEEKALEYDQSDVNAWCGLANVLIELGEIEEATKWYEKAFEARMGFYGARNDFTIFTAYRLGYCYYKQSKYCEALDLYNKMVNMRHEPGKGQKAISDFESYILYIRGRIAMGNMVGGLQALEASGS